MYINIKEGELMGYNASQTKSPICYDLKETDYKAYCDGYIFCFSSIVHRDKFLRECIKRKEWMNDSMSRRFHVPCDFSVLALFQLYMQIEGRGFYVYNDVGELFEKPTDIMFEVICYEQEN